MGFEADEGPHPDNLETEVNASEDTEALKSEGSLPNGNPSSARQGKCELLRRTGFSCLPCFHCRKDAVNPMSDRTIVNSFLIYGSLSVGYICQDCNDRTWFSGGRWI